MTLIQSCLTASAPESDRDKSGEIIMIKNTGVGRSARTLSLGLAVAAIATAFATQPVPAQRLGGGMPSAFGGASTAMPSAFGGASTAMPAPGTQLHAVNPSLSLIAPATSPIRQQMQDDYATNLMSAQRQLLQQNPSGVSRPELSIGDQHNGFMAPR
jgi:hypothetical protein